MKVQKLMNPRQIGEYLGFEKRTITRWCREGRFKTARKVGRVWRIDAQEVIRLGKKPPRPSYKKSSPTGQAGAPEPEVEREVHSSGV